MKKVAIMCYRKINFPNCPIFDLKILAGMHFLAVFYAYCGAGQ